MQDYLEDNHEDYCSILHEKWCDLLSTIEVKYNRKRYATQIKRLATSKTASCYDRNISIRVPHKKRVRKRYLPNLKRQGGKTPNNHGAQSCCILCKKSVMPE